jgi:pimeloyl-ACP methyl ester carboxylesterase
VRGAAALVALALAGCKLATLHEDVAVSSREGAIVGRVAHHEPDPTNLVAFALAREDGKLVARNYTSFATADGFVMRGDAGASYVVGVFADRNDNLRPDPDEPAVLAAAPVTVPTGWKSAAHVELVLAPESRLPPEAQAALQDLAKIERKPLPLALGEVVALDDERFSPQTGQVGMWAPFDFAVNVGGGVYFLEPYDPKRVPVLFVSGIGGNPREWQAFVDALDRSRYQAWFYLYPSGAPLGTSALVLDRCVGALHRQYGFQRLYVTAHSMGGLVARGFIVINQHEDENHYLRLFVSIATPWNGIEWARIGVERSPTVMPSWVDLQPGSDYQRAVFARPFAPPLDYYLLWGQKDPGAPRDKASDGVVAVTSELRAEAVSDARSVSGFTADHRGILRSPEAIATWRGILDEASRRR